VPRRPCVLLLSLLLSLLLVVLGGVSAGAATTDPTTTTTTSPGTSPTTTTTSSKPVTTTPTTIPSAPSGEHAPLSPDQTLVTPREFAELTDGQRALLRQLQTAKDALAARRFALVALAKDATAARDRLDAARNVEAKARARADETANQIRNVKLEIINLAAAAYRNHAPDRALGAIGSFSATRASALSRAQTYVQADATLLRQRVDALNVLERRLKSEQHNAESARADAEASATDLDAQLAAQTQAFSDATDAAAKIQSALVRSFGSGASVLAQIIDPHFGADDITTALAGVQKDQGDPLTLDGIFAMPIAGAPIASHFGMRIDPIGGGIGFHSGVDFAADARTPIHAAAGGVVVIVGDCGGYGNCVVIDHGSSLATIYAHQSVVIARVGYVVTAGEPIGLVGSTGLSTGPHLHFEVRLHGAPIDPLPTLAG
jgi:murein DD-endopeptidase MepM/ murein hydrolase activator NlpD